MNAEHRSSVDVIVKYVAGQLYNDPQAPKHETLLMLKSRAMRHFRLEATPEKVYFLDDRKGRIEDLSQTIGDFATGAHRIELELIEGIEPHSKDLHVLVAFAGAKDPIEFVWPKTEKVGKAADQAAHAFGIKPETPPTLQDEKDRVFDRDKTLEQEHVHGGAELELVAGGGGV